MPQLHRSGCMARAIAHERAADALNVSVASENGSEELRVAPVCRARSLEQARERRPARLSAQAALLELLAAAAWAGIVPADALERVNKRLGHVCKGQTNIL